MASAGEDNANTLNLSTDSASSHARVDTALPSDNVFPESANATGRVRFAFGFAEVESEAPSLSATTASGTNSAGVNKADSSLVGPHSSIDQYEIQVSHEDLLDVAYEGVDRTKRKMVLKYLSKSARRIQHSLTKEDRVITDFVGKLTPDSFGRHESANVPVFFMYCSELLFDHAGAVFPLEITAMRWTVKNGLTPASGSKSAIFHCIFGLEFCPSHQSGTWNENLERKGLGQAVAFTKLLDSLNLPECDTQPPENCESANYYEANTEIDYQRGMSLGRLPFQRTQDKFDDLLSFLSDGIYQSKHTDDELNNGQSAENSTGSEYPDFSEKLIFVPEDNLETTYGTLNFLHAVWKHERVRTIPADRLLQNRIFRFEGVVAEFMLQGVPTFQKAIFKLAGRKLKFSEQLIDIVKLACGQLHDGLKWDGRSRCMNHNASDSEHCTLSHVQAMRWLWSDYVELRKVLHDYWKIADMDADCHRCTVFEDAEKRMNSFKSKEMSTVPRTSYSRVRDDNGDKNRARDDGIRSGASVSSHTIRSRLKNMGVNSARSEEAAPMNACDDCRESCVTALGRGIRSATKIDAPYTSTFYRGTTRVADLNENLRTAPPVVAAENQPGRPPAEFTSSGAGRGRGVPVGFSS